MPQTIEPTTTARARQHEAQTDHHPWTQTGCDECQAIRYQHHRERYPLDRWVARFLGYGANGHPGFIRLSEFAA